MKNLVQYILEKSSRTLCWRTFFISYSDTFPIKSFSLGGFYLMLTEDILNWFSPWTMRSVVENKVKLSFHFIKMRICNYAWSRIKKKWLRKFFAFGRLINFLPRVNISFCFNAAFSLWMQQHKSIHCLAVKFRKASWSENPNKQLWWIKICNFLSLLKNSFFSLESIFFPTFNAQW